MHFVDTTHGVTDHPPTDVSTSAVACVNCGRTCNGAYCSVCGQRQSTGRHTLRSVLGGIVGRFISIEHGFAHTVISLTIRPGAVITGYWAGQTVRYTHPAGYLLVSVAIFALALRWFVGPTGASDGDRWLTLLIVPLIAAMSRVMFWRASYNYAEHLIAVMYLCGHVLLAWAVLSVGIPFVSDAGTAYGIAALVLATTYVLWGYSRAFSARPVVAVIVGLIALVLGIAAWFASIVLLVKWRS